ncbi:MAG: hypothetical protein NXH90_15670 [Flavobacteriaceae bacterium]|nr:hypothetical protein [Flavobacteriaceae bacterium]
MKPNRYIKAMEIGLAREKEGISYFDLIAELEKQPDFKFGNESELTFLVWFSQNFRRSDKDLTRGDVQKYRWHIKQRNGDNLSVEQQRTAEVIVNDLKYKYWLNGEASKQYLDYQELVESRKAATQAKKQSNISIGIAIFALLVSAGVGILSVIVDLVAYYKSPVPPYDVKIMEDNTRTQQLERENGQLKEELYKAEMMLEAYDSDTLK